MRGALQVTFTYVFTYFLVTLVCASVCIALLIQLKADMGSEQEIRAFRGYLVWYMLFTLTNAIWVWINYGFLKIPGSIFSILNLISICTASYYWFIYVELRLNPLVLSNTRFRVASFLPLLVAILLVVTTPWTGLVFHYNESNEYIHGPLYSTMAVLAIIYLVVASTHLAVYRKNTKSPMRRRQYLTLMLFLVYPVLAGVIDIIIPNLPIMELALLLGTMLVYTNMQQSQMYNDVLTGLNNRRLADEYLLEQLADASQDSPVYFLLGDADQFKEINDKRGHVEGDRALRLIAEALKEATVDVRCHVARWGGDEFAIVMDKSAECQPSELIDKIDAELARVAKRNALEYPLHLSFGYAKCTTPGLSVSKIVEEADSHMYRSKAAYISQQAVASA